MINKNLKILKELVETSGNCVNLGRSMKVHNPSLYQWVLDNTSFLDSKNNVKFNERVYCILNDMHEIQLNIYGENAKFVNLFSGYSLKKNKYKRNESFRKKIELKEHRRQIQKNTPKKTSIDKFKERNRKRNAHLYEHDGVVGVDYMICPVSNERMAMIRKDYIQRVLKMSVEEYDRLYPGVRGVSKKRLQNVKQGLHEIDKDTGLTKHQIAVAKTKEKLSTIDSNTGLSGYALKGQKTRATHMKNVDEYGRNGYSQLASKAIIKGNLTKAEKGFILDPRFRDEYFRYKSIVLYATEKFRKEITAGYKTGLAGTPGAYHMDHMFSIMDGYKNQVSPLLIGNKSNLKMIPWEENLIKHSSSSISFETLLSNTKYTLEKSQREYACFLDLIETDIKKSNSCFRGRINGKIL